MTFVSAILHHAVTIQSRRLLAARSFTQIRSVTCWHIMQTRIVTLSALSAEVWRRVVQVLSFWSVACWRCIYTYGTSAPFIQLEHTVSFVLSVYEAAYEEIILSSWRGNEEITHWDDITCLPEGKQKKDIYIIVIFWLFFGLSVSCWFKKLSRCGTLPWGPSCGANHFRGLLRSAWPLDWPIYPGGGGGAVHTGWTETTRWFCPEVTRVFTE